MLPGPNYLQQLRAAGATCGVTRLADITGLDAIGLPVWQAVRPASRSLSVHQGKGRTAVSAMIGALSEAIECDCAERVEPDGPVAGFERLDPARLAPRLNDYARVRDSPPPAGPVAWCSAINVATGQPALLPHALVSLDFTRLDEPWFERSSSGMGAGPDLNYSLSTALCELIERDSVGEWERAPLVDRIESALDLDSIAASWFVDLRDRLQALGMTIRIFVTDAVVAMPVLVCWIEGQERFGPHRRRFGGSGASADPETALFRAVAEAVQSRLTFIAAVRDDMLPSAYQQDQAPSLMRIPPVPPGGAQRSWQSIQPHPSSPEAVVDALAAAGFPHVAMKRLDRGLAGTVVLKAHVGGLGSLFRSRAH